MKIQGAILVLLLLPVIGVLGACASGEGPEEPSPGGALPTLSPLTLTPGPSGSPQDLAAIYLPDALVSGKPTLAEFGRGTCLPCKQMKPILEELAAEYGDTINVVIVEIQNHMDLTRSYKIVAIPTQIFFDAEGKEVDRHIGFYAREKIVARFAELGFLKDE